MLAAVPFMLIFRFLHILSGVLWVGSAFVFILFIGPSAGEVGPSAGPLLTAVVKRRKFPMVITSLAGTTVLAGWVMWLRDMHITGSLYQWVTSRFGLVITIGAVLATVAFIEGMFGVGRNVDRMVTLGGEIGAAGGPPSAEQQAEMARLQGDLKKYGMIDLILMVLAVIAMATARYW